MDGGGGGDWPTSPCSAAIMRMQAYRKYVSSVPFLGAAAFLALLPGVDAATGFFGVLGLVLGAIVRC